MSVEQRTTVSGNIYQRYTEDSPEFRENTMPRLGQKCVFEDGREFIFCSTNKDFKAGDIVGKRVCFISELMAKAYSGVREIRVRAAFDVDYNHYYNGYVSFYGDPDSVDTRVYKIAGSTAGVLGSTITLILYDGLYQTANLGQELGLKSNRAQGLVLCEETDPDEMQYDYVGAAVSTSDAATTGKTNYLWVQYRGVGNARYEDGNADFGRPLIVGPGAGLAQPEETNEFGRGILYKRVVAQALIREDVTNGTVALANFDFIT